MDWDALALIAGLGITTATLFDVFATVVVPGRVGGPINAPRLLRTSLFRLWRCALKLCTRNPYPRIDSIFGAMLLLVVLLVWVVLTLFGLSLAAWALRRDFDPPIDSFGDAAFQIGSAMMTLGLSGQTAIGWARALIVWAGLCGFQIMTLTLSFIVQIQTALKDRDALVLRLASRAGTPPSGVALLTTMRELDPQGGLPQFFERWENWSAMVLYTHAAHPGLSYFRSDEGVIDWLTALGTVLDAASLTLAMLTDTAQGNARLMHRSGIRTVRQLCRAFRLDPQDAPELTDADIGGAARRLREAGYTVEPGQEAKLRELQGTYRRELAALACHFGVDMPAWGGAR